MKHFSSLEHEVWLPYKFAVGPVFHKFYNGLIDKKILGAKCSRCGKILVPPRSFCPECNVNMEEYVEVAQQGVVETWTYINSESYGLPVKPPFVGALIRLENTDCNLLHLIGGFDATELDAVKSKIKRGVKVKAVWNDERTGHMLDIKYFEPVND